MNQSLPEIKLRKTKTPKKLRRQMPFDISSLEAILNPSYDAQLTTYGLNLLEDKTEIRHLVGSYERYYWDAKTLVRDILTIKSNGNVVIKSSKGTLEGDATYSLNSILTIRINTFNNTPFFEQISCFVGRYDFSQINCLYALIQSINANNVPFSRHDALVPIAQGEISAPEVFVPESLPFFKIEKKYPELVKYIQARTTHGFNRVDW